MFYFVHIFFRVLVHLVNSFHVFKKNGKDKFLCLNTCMNSDNIE